MKIRTKIITAIILAGLFTSMAGVTAQAQEFDPTVCIAALPKCDDLGNPISVSPTSPCYADARQACHFVAMEQCKIDKNLIKKSFKKQIRELKRKLKSTRR